MGGKKKAYFRTLSSPNLILVVDTRIAGQTSDTQFKIPVSGYGYDYTISTSDGQYISGITTAHTITFPSAGIYEIEISGDYPQSAFNSTTDARKVTEIKNWGKQVWRDFQNAWRGMYNMHITATDAPDLSECLTFRWAFYDARVMNEDIGHWDVSNISTFGSCFINCLEFNNGGSPSINNWDVSGASGTGFEYMFNTCYKFNQPLDSWNVSGGGSFSYMFYRCYEFNQDLNSWDVSTGYKFDDMFRQCFVFNGNISSWTFKTTGTISTIRMLNNCQVFNQDISGWDTQRFTNMHNMFGNAYIFNQDISGWDVSLNTDFSNMFASAYDFNQPIGIWNVANSTSFATMFQDTIAFNQPIGAWNVTNSMAFNSMFQDTIAFNQPIGAWNVSNSTTLASMFYGAGAFNQDLTNWDTSNCSNYTSMFELSPFAGDVSGWIIGSGTMTRMFRNCSSFNSDVSGWNVTNITDVTQLFYGCTLMNPNIGGWNMTGKTSIYYMCRLTELNRDLSSWDISSVTNADEFCTNISFSSTNYDALLIAWALQTVQPNVVFDIKGAKRTTASDSAKAVLEAEGWIITDGGYV